MNLYQYWKISCIVSPIESSSHDISVKMKKDYRIEICANSVESAVLAQTGGACRVELCAGIPEGGTTPSFGEILTARSVLRQTKLHVIIRPRGGDFLYSNTELEIMLHDIEQAKELGVDGVVFGCLTADGDIDMKAMERLMKKSDGLSMTFHRAFDVCRNYRKALNDIISLGCQRILTSGQQPNAVEGIPLLKKLVELAGERIIIMPGCGINPLNIRKIAEKTGANEFHFSGRSTRESRMRFRNPNVSMGGTVRIDEYRQDVTDPYLVEAALQALLTRTP